MIEGGSSRHYSKTKSLMWGEPEAWRELMERVVDVLVPYAALQVKGGAAAIQVFDSWVGALSPSDYQRFALPYSRSLISGIQATGVPVIHFGTGNGAFLEVFGQAGATCWAWIGGWISAAHGTAWANAGPCKGIWTRSPC